MEDDGPFSAAGSVYSSSSRGPGCRRLFSPCTRSPSASPPPVGSAAPSAVCLVSQPRGRFLQTTMCQIIINPRPTKQKLCSSFKPCDVTGFSSDNLQFGIFYIIFFLPLNRATSPLILVLTDSSSDFNMSSLFLRSSSLSSCSSARIRSFRFIRLFFSRFSSLFFSPSSYIYNRTCT